MGGEVTHYNATSASLKHFTWAHGLSAFCCRALLSANTEWHVLVRSHPEASLAQWARPARLAPSGPAAPLPPPTHCPAGGA